MPEQDREPARLGKYELLDLVEEGVGGSLYHARHVETGRAALVKTIAPALSGMASFGKYFYDTWADQQSLIEHPNVLHTLDVGKEGDVHYVAVEDAGGRPLSELLASGPLATDEAIDILHQAAEGLRAAHRRDVVHGHLKPSDIRVGTDEMGRRLVKVAFFDLGVSVADSMAPVYGELLGSPKYLAPEVIRGRLPMPESDVFSLGVIAYEMLTGSEPFPSDNAVGYLFANCSAEARPADEVREGLPHEVALVVARMLEKEPARRYRSMQRLMDDLDRCVAGMRTGRVEVVPYGTDSAFARDYELTRPAGQKPAAPRTSWFAYAAVALAVVAVGLLAFYRPGWGDRAGAGPVPTPPGLTTPALTSQQPAEPGGPPPAPAVSQPPAQRAQAALEKAAADWQRHQQTRDYELAVTAFNEVADRFPGTAAADEARREMGRIYTEWARYLADQGDFAGCVEKYRTALQISPADSPFVELARGALPAAMVRWADAERGRGDYKHALEIYREVAEQYPGTMEAGLYEKRRPELLLSHAFSLWKDAGDIDGAIAAFTTVTQEYAGTESAEKAASVMPELYLDSVRQKLERGELAEARRQLGQIAETYADQEVARKARDLDAEVLFGLFKQAQDAGDAALSGQRYGELLQRYPDSAWAVQAVRLKLGLERVAGEATFSASTARAQLNTARQHYDRFEHSQALEALKSVVRYAKAESREAAEALALLPAWAYEDALYSYGKGLPIECKKKLAELSEQFPNTIWSARAAQTLKNIEEAPEGMVYVPEGRFRMGTDMDVISQIIRDQQLSPVLDDPEAIKMAAQFYGLLGETPRHTATTGAYYIDKTEVTNLQYKEYLDATGYVAPAHWPDGNYPAGQASFPVSGITLADAQRYAEWRGCRLPTEAEWEKAARGTDGRRFPWGDSYGENRARHMLPATAGPASVGSIPNWPSPYGCLDMIGNVQEWTTSDFAPYPGSLMEETPPQGLKVTRGGAWSQAELVPIPSACASRYPWDPSQPDVTLGFRCVKDAPTASAPQTGP